MPFHFSAECGVGILWASKIPAMLESRLKSSNPLLLVVAIGEVCHHLMPSWCSSFFFFTLLFLFSFCFFFSFFLVVF